MGSRISIKQLHQSTGDQVRRAARSQGPITITDRGKPVAVLAKPSLLAGKPRRRTILPEYKALLARKSSGSVLDDLDAVRDDR
jgi:prevent-host-death family protein